MKLTCMVSVFTLFVVVMKVIVSRTCSVLMYSLGTRNPNGNLSEEVLTQFAQAKFEAREDRLKDVACLSVALIRDFPKLSTTADVDKKILDTRIAPLEYVLQ